MPQDLGLLRAAVEREMRAREAEHEQLRAMTLRDRVAAGFTLQPLDLLSVEHRSRGRFNAVLRGHDTDDAFSPGDPVTLGPAGRQEGGFAARVEGVDRTTIELRVDGEPDGRGPWAVSRRLDLTVSRLQLAVLTRAEDRSSPLKNLLLGYEPPYRPDPLEHPALASLNPSQRIAAATALGTTEIGLLHGPPGTGKTETLVAMLRALADLGEKPWALAESNAAVDHLALRSAAAGLDVVRLGVSARIGTEVLPLSLEHRILHGPRAAVIRALLREATRASGSELAEVQANVRDQWQAAKREILTNASVIAMTLGTLHTRGASLTPPRTAVVDEASQVMEPDLWLLASLVKRMILAGDPHQLGPVVKSRDPLLERSLLARLVEEGFQFPMLTTQYRMSQPIHDVVNAMYHGALTADPVAANRTMESLGAAPGAWTQPGARFVDTAGAGLDEEPDDLGSLHNPGEVDILVRIVRSLRESGVAASHIAIVTPYRAQVARIRDALPDIDSGTVNAFQGREREVILASFVRSNPEGDLGFVADQRRLTVTVSRARRLFIGIGDSATLGRSPAYAALIESLNAAGGYSSVWELE